MKTYRLLASESTWDNRRVIYGIAVHNRDIRVRGHRESKEYVFEAADDTVATRVFEIYVKEFKNENGKWSASLQLVRVENGVVHRIRTLRTVVNA